MGLYIYTLLMSIHTYICMYICTCMYIYVCTSLYIYICIHKYTYIYICIQIGACLYAEEGVRSGLVYMNINHDVNNTLLCKLYIYMYSMRMSRQKNNSGRQIFAPEYVFIYTNTYMHINSHTYTWRQQLFTLKCRYSAFPAEMKGSYTYIYIYLYIHICMYIHIYVYVFLPWSVGIPPSLLRWRDPGHRAPGAGPEYLPGGKRR
jgi:hypothetical protein